MHTHKHMTHLPVTFGLFILCVNSSSTNQYMGFGLSRSPTATLMFGADPTITWVDEISGPQAVDYHLSAYTQVCLAEVLVVVLHCMSRSKVPVAADPEVVTSAYPLSAVEYTLSAVEHMLYPR